MPKCQSCESQEAKHVIQPVMFMGEMMTIEGDMCRPCQLLVAHCSTFTVRSRGDGAWTVSLVLSEDDLKTTESEQEVKIMRLGKKLGEKPEEASAEERAKAEAIVKEAKARREASAKRMGGEYLDVP